MSWIKSFYLRQAELMADCYYHEVEDLSKYFIGNAIQSAGLLLHASFRHCFTAMPLRFTNLHLYQVGRWICTILVICHARRTKERPPETGAFAYQIVVGPQGLEPWTTRL